MNKKEFLSALGVGELSPCADALYEHASALFEQGGTPFLNEAYLARFGIVKAHKKIYDGGFSRPRRAYYCDGFSAIGAEGDVL